MPASEEEVQGTRKPKEEEEALRTAVLAGGLWGGCPSGKISPLLRSGAEGPKALPHTRQSLVVPGKWREREGVGSVERGQREGTERRGSGCSGLGGKLLLSVGIKTVL